MDSDIPDKQDDKQEVPLYCLPALVMILYTIPRYKFPYFDKASRVTCIYTSYIILFKNTKVEGPFWKSVKYVKILSKRPTHPSVLKWWLIPLQCKFQLSTFVQLLFSVKNRDHGNFNNFYTFTTRVNLRTLISRPHMDTATSGPWTDGLLLSHF